jgi:hypothetical protein
MKIKLRSLIQHRSILQYMLNDTCHSGVSIKEGNMMPLATHLILLESPWWMEVHWDCFIMFRYTMQELLNINKYVKKIQQN